MKSEDIKRIRRMRKNGTKLAEIARLLGFAIPQIEFACNTSKQETNPQDPTPEEIQKACAAFRAQHLAALRVSQYTPTYIPGIRECKIK